MKILHCCLADFYIDNYGYQQNILPKMHLLQGHEVRILASTETYIDNKYLGYVNPSSYITPEGIPITRIPYKMLLPFFLIKKIRIYEGIFSYLNSFKPDVIFIHDTQFFSITEIKKYAKVNKVTIYADGHADFVKHKGRNFLLNWFSEKLLHGIFYKWCTLQIEPYTKKFYGVLPLRVEFIKNIYGVPKDKVELLVMGADDTLFDLSKKSEIRSRVRNCLGLLETDFVIITGGRIDRTKKIEMLMKSVKEIENESIKLIVFGTPDENLKSIIDELKISEKILYLGWLHSSEVYNYFMAADLAFFPGTHSVLWEQAVGVGLPCVFKKWKGVEHVDLGGNCMFIEESEPSLITTKVMYLFNNKEELNKMKIIAEEKGCKHFSYFDIAKRAIEN